MLAVTERAAVQMEELLRINHAAPGQGVRLVPSSAGNFGMAIDAPSERDEVTPKPNREEPLVIVDDRMAGALEGAEIDYETVVVNGEPRSQFTLLPPSALR